MQNFFFIFYILIEVFFSSLSVAIAVGAAVVQGLGFMKIAKKVGVKNGWMAFIPFASSLLFGRLAEESDRRAYPDKEPRKWGKTLLAANIAFTAGVFVLAEAFALYISLYIIRASSNDPGVFENFNFWLPVIIAYALFFVLMFTIAAIYSVVYYLVIYRVYRMMAGKNAVWMLLLSIFVNAAVTVIAAILGFSKKFPLPGTDGARTPVLEQQAYVQS